jgi:hypothetical protein
MRSAVTVTTETSAGGRAVGLASFFPHALNKTPSAVAARQKATVFETIGFISS